ncbi:unnamed protein product [Trichobilharzia regenti]|nr:unnamed protein product [Trichobilharzia regenti]
MIVGRHTVRVKYGGQEIPESPFLVPVAPSGRANLCRIESKQDLISLLCIYIEIKSLYYMVIFRI